VNGSRNRLGFRLGEALLLSVPVALRGCRESRSNPWAKMIVGFGCPPEEAVHPPLLNPVLE